MKDRPKAAHFDAWLSDGPVIGKLPWNDPVGREYRWAVAGAIEREICRDMGHANDYVRGKIRRRLIQANVGRKVIVCLAGECPMCCGTGSVDSGGIREDGTWIEIPCECIEETAE